jgi:TrmH family RNA methyltransferase
MTQREITSLQHPIVKHFVKLRKSRAFRKETGSALIVGTKLVKELAAKFPLKTLFMEKGSEKIACKAENCFVVTAEILKKITGLETAEPYAAEITLPQAGSLKGKKFLLALDGISDPGNLGTLLRTALALGWEGVFITDESTDPFNEKALRAAKGSTFHLPIQEGSREELNELIEKNGLQVYLAESEGKDVGEVEFSSPLILVLGSEAHGVRFLSKKKASVLSIPMDKKMESLNVAAAGAILMYLMREKR